MSRNLILWALVGVTFIGTVLIGQRLVAQSTYDLPNDNTACPANCRQIPWKAGSDLWNGGTLPNYAQTTCTGLSGNGTTNDGPAIQNCIDSASAGTAIYIPAGVYYVNSTLRMKSNVALRGAMGSAAPYLPAANPSATTFKLGSNGGVSFWRIDRVERRHR